MTGEAFKLMPDNYMVINGERYPVINAWVETDSGDGRKRWGIVTEAPSIPPCEVPVGCARPGCGESPTAHLGFVLGHQYEAEVQPAQQPVAPAGATAEACKRCGRTFVEDGKFVDSAAQYLDFPYCKTCVDRCHDTEIADHWCEIDKFREERQSPAGLERQSGTPRMADGPGCTPHVVRPE